MSLAAITFTPLPCLISLMRIMPFSRVVLDLSGPHDLHAAQDRGSSSLKIIMLLDIGDHS